jgi:hypothetical protein
MGPLQRSEESCLPYLPIGSRLRSRLDAILADLISLTSLLATEYFERDGGGVVFVMPDYHWASLSPLQAAQQLKLKRDYNEWHELLSMVLHSAPDALTHRLSAADERFRTWVELGSNWSLTSSADKNRERLMEAAQELYGLVDILQAAPSGEIILIPDTNTLVEHPDPVTYRQIAQNGQFTFLLLPSVLGELDELKINHRNQEIREGAKAAIRRIKGWRLQGSLRVGVTVDHTITVRAAHQEPSMNSALSWLDGSVRDDRIVASALEVQATLPGAVVVLVTSDINLQNKADAAAIQVTELPEDNQYS